MKQRKIEILTDTDVLITLSNTQKQEYFSVYNLFGEMADQEIVVSVSIISELEIIQGSKNNVEKKQVDKISYTF